MVSKLQGDLIKLRLAIVLPADKISILNALMDLQIWDAITSSEFSLKKMAGSDALKSDAVVTYISDSCSKITVLSGAGAKFSNLQQSGLNNNQLPQISADIWS